MHHGILGPYICPCKTHSRKPWSTRLRLRWLGPLHCLGGRIPVVRVALAVARRSPHMSMYSRHVYSRTLHRMHNCCTWCMLALPQKGWRLCHGCEGGRLCHGCEGGRRCHGCEGVRRCHGCALLPLLLQDIHSCVSDRWRGRVVVTCHLCWCRGIAHSGCELKRATSTLHRCVTFQRIYLLPPLAQERKNDRPWPKRETSALGR